MKSMDGQTAQAQPQTKTVLDILLSEKLITPQQYSFIKLESLNRSIAVEQVILERKIATQEQMTEAKARLLGVPFISLSTRGISPDAISLIPQSVSQRFGLIPFDYDKAQNTLSVAMADPADIEAISFIRQKSGARINVLAASLADIQEAISSSYAQSIVSQVKEVVEEIGPDPGRVIKSEDLPQIIKEAPVARMVSTILEYAVKSRASDVHIEPQDDRTRVRYRIDGILHERLSLPKTVHDALASRIKILSEMKIDEHRIPQDGRFNFRVGKEEVDLRVSSLPTAHGEKIVMRLLRKSGGVPSMSDLGLRGTSLKNLESAILRPHGIIIVCGPTGSGKTTTLYAVLSKLNTIKVNIVTLEDPIEYEMVGVNQVQINPGVGLTFATGLRSFLRQDPNIILVGEIRDRETTDLAIQAALTGHLVFSTLHTSNAAGVLPRLLDLGAETFLLASTMNGIVGQRIGRKICSHCKESYVPAPTLVEDIKAILGKLMPPILEGGIKLYRGKGCGECGDTGYLGRVGIFEVLPVSEKIAHLILERADSNTIEKEAILEGMITMKQDGYLKVLEGVTTIEEVLRVAEE